MSQRIDTRTVHTIEIDIDEKILLQLHTNDEIEVCFTGLSGRTNPRKLSYTEKLRLLGHAH